MAAARAGAVRVLGPLAARRVHEKTRSGRLIRAPTFCEVARVPRERAALWAGPEMRLPSAAEVLRVLERARAAQDREGVRAARMERA